MPRKIKNLFHFCEALIAFIINGFPSNRLTLIGVTGTDGKTTTVSLIYHIIVSSGNSAGMITTLGAKINGRDFSTGLHTTTPSPFLIQKLLRKMVAEKCRFAVLEVTSHALDQYRLAFCHFKTAAVTNITRDHFDYHKSYLNYLNAKLKLLKNAGFSVLNKDDLSFSKVTSALKKPYFTYGLHCYCDLKAVNIKQTGSGQEFNIIGNYRHREINFPVKTGLFGEYNVYNLLAAASVCLYLGISPDDISKSIGTFLSVKGRMEIVFKEPFKVIVDFAHTPNAFTQVLTTARQMTSGKLIHVFGATGKRDRDKRPLMGEISGRLADFSILTSEDTYGENPLDIIIQLEEGVLKTGKRMDRNYWKIPDRNKAIKQALELAQSGDTVLITGVGHQTTLNIGQKEIPWNDVEVVKALLKTDS